MSTSWQLSREADVERHVHRVEQLYHNFCQKAKRTRLILEYFEDGVKDAALELKSASEAQFRITAPKVEAKLVEAIKFEKQIQHLFEQNMAMTAHTTEFGCPSDSNVLSHKPSYTMTPTGVYTPEHTPYSTGPISSYTADSTYRVFGQSPEGMESFPQNLSIIRDPPTLHLQTPVVGSVHAGEDTEAQNVKNEQSLSNKRSCLPPCNLSFSEDDATSLYSTENDAGQKYGCLSGGLSSLYISPDQYPTPPQAVNIDLPSSGRVTNTATNMNKNNPNDACIDIPDDIFIDAAANNNNTVTSEPDEVFLSANNTVNSDGFLTPNSLIYQENSKHEIVIDIDTNDFNDKDQLGSSNEGGGLSIKNQADHTGTAKRKRDSSTPLKKGESNTHVNASENMMAANAPNVNAGTRAPFCNSSYDNVLSSFHVEIESTVDQTITQNDNILMNVPDQNMTQMNDALNNLQPVIDSTKNSEDQKMTQEHNILKSTVEQTQKMVQVEDILKNTLEQKITQENVISKNTVEKNKTQVNYILNKSQTVIDDTVRFKQKENEDCLTDKEESPVVSSCEAAAAAVMYKSITTLLPGGLCLPPLCLPPAGPPQPHPPQPLCLPPAGPPQPHPPQPLCLPPAGPPQPHPLQPLCLPPAGPPQPHPPQPPLCLPPAGPPQPHPPPLQQYTPVYATHLQAPNQVWIQLEHCGIEQFQYELNVSVGQLCVESTVPEELITLHSYVVAPYEASNEFYRAQVSCIIKENEETYVQVSYLDYGNSEMVKMSSLVMMPESLMKVPCKAILCVLEKVNGCDVSSLCGDEFDLLFTQLVNNSPLVAYITQSEDEPVKGGEGGPTREYADNEVVSAVKGRPRPRYVVTLSEDLVCGTVVPDLELSKEDESVDGSSGSGLDDNMSGPQPQCAAAAGSSYSCSSGSTTYRTYHTTGTPTRQNDQHTHNMENINHPTKIGNMPEKTEDCPQQNHEPSFDMRDQVVEGSQKLELDEVDHCAQKKGPDDLYKNDELKSDSKTSQIVTQQISPGDFSRIEEFKNDSKTSVKEKQSQEKDLPTKDEKAYTALQRLCTVKVATVEVATVERTADKKVKKALQRKSVNTDNVKVVNKSELRLDHENGGSSVSGDVVEAESIRCGSGVSYYSGKWSCLVPPTDTTEYTLNAAGKVVNFSSNESCKVASPGHKSRTGTQIKGPDQVSNSSHMQKSCRARQISGAANLNASLSQNTLGTLAANQLVNTIHPINTQSDYCSILKNQTAQNQQQQASIEQNYNKSSHLILPSSNGKQSPISDDGNSLEYISNVLSGSVKAGPGSGRQSESDHSDILVPVEVLPDVKLPQQTVPSLGEAQEQVQVMVSHVDSPHSFFLHLINSETACIERYTENMTEHYKNDSDDLKVERLPVGSFWAVRFKDNCWYRAQVLASQPKKANEELHVTVRFVDHGDSGIISIKDVRVLAETFTFMPMLALPCTLAKVSPLNEWEDHPWNQQTITGFIKLCGNFTSILQAHFISYSLNAHYDVVLENEFGGVINEMMVQQGFAKSRQLQSIGKDLFTGFTNAAAAALPDDDCSMINNASDSPILDDLSILSCVKQTFKFTSVTASSPMQPSKWGNNRASPVSVNLLKTSNQNMIIPILPCNIKSVVGNNMIPPININDDKCERGFVRKLCESYGFIEHFGYQSSLFFHYSEFYGDVDFLDIGDLVEFEICFDEFRCKPMAVEVHQTMSHQERLLGTVNEEILESSDRKQCITYMDAQRFLYITFDGDDVEGYVNLKALDRVSFSINLDSNRGALTATCISLESSSALEPCQPQHYDQADHIQASSGSLMDPRSSLPNTRWDPMAESYSKGYNYQNDECAETLITGIKNTDLTRLCKFYRVDGKCPRGDTCRFEHTLLNKGAVTVEKEEVFMDLLGDPNLPKEASVVACVVTYVTSPAMFYCYLPYGGADLRPGTAKDSGIGLTNNGEGLGGLLQSMSEHYRHSLPTPNRALPAAGELKAAPLLSEDGEHEWWRVRVLEITGNELDNVNVKVHFLDYGEVKWIEETKLRPLDVQFLHLPAQAVECWLYDVGHPVPGGWSSAAKDHFTDLTKDRMLVGQILHSDERIQRLGIKLFDTAGVAEININDVMINY